MTTQAYALQHNGYHWAADRWDPVEKAYVNVRITYDSPLKGRFLRQGGVTTEDIQKAMTVFKDSKRSASRFGATPAYEWVPVTVIPTAELEALREKAARYDGLCK